MSPDRGVVVTPVSSARATARDIVIVVSSTDSMVSKSNPARWRVNGRVGKASAWPRGATSGGHHMSVNVGACGEQAVARTMSCQASSESHVDRLDRARRIFSVVSRNSTPNRPTPTAWSA